MSSCFSPYDEAIRFLRERTNFENFRSIPYAQMAVGLERLRRAYRFFDDANHPPRTIHIAGTKGKGTVAAMLERILRAEGYKTGLFTSPHLFQIEERFALDGAPCAPDELAEAILQVRDRLAEFARQDGLSAPEDGADGGWTFFEISFLAATLLFRQKRVDWAILETGLGGRFDATNVCEPDICVITTIGFDHCEQLGATLPQIAAEKAGIIKPNVPAVSGILAEKTLLSPTTPVFADRAAAAEWRRTELTAERIDAAEAVIRRIAEEKGAPLTEIDALIEEEREFPVPLPGLHQKINAKIALTTLHRLQADGKIGPLAKRAFALRGLTLPARFDVFSESPLCVADGAHNRQSAAALADALRERFGETPKTLVFATTAGKDVAGMFFELFPHFETVVLTAYDGPRALSVERIAETARRIASNCSPQPKIERVENIDTFFRSPLFERLPKHAPHLYCFTGSFYFAASVLQTWKKEGQNG